MSPRTGLRNSRRARIGLVVAGVAALVAAGLGVTADAGVAPAGPVTVTVAGGTIGSPLGDLGPIDGTLTGTVNASGGLNFPASGVHFEGVEMQITTPIPATIRVTPTAVSAFTGTVDPAAGTLALSGQFTISVQIPALLVFGCPVGPVSLALTGAYDGANGQGSIADSTFVIPAIPAGHFGCGGFDALINSTLGLPTAPGAGTVTWPVSFAPVLNDATTTTTTAGPPPGPAISISDQSIVETDKKPAKMTFTVSLSAPTDHTVKVKAHTVDGTASSVGKADFTAVNPKLISIPKGQTSKTVTVNITGDTVAESTETFTVVLDNNVGAPIADGTGVGTITDTDPIHISVVDQEFPEGASNNTILVTVAIDRPSDNTVKAKLTTTNGSAADPTDFKKKTNTAVTIKPGATTGTVKVTVVGDGVVEPDESFTVTLTEPAGAVFGSPGDATATITILDDDGNPT